MTGCEAVVAAHDSGLVVNPLAFEGQVEGGVAMGLGFALTETFPLEDCVPTTRFGQLGLLRAKDVPPVQTIIVRKGRERGCPRRRRDGRAYGAKGIGEISTIPTAAAVPGAYSRRTESCGRGCPWKERRTGTAKLAAILPLDTYYTSV